MKNFSEYKTVILANGEFPTHALPLQLLYQAEILICCDGAINNLVKLNIEPTVIIGDFDSLSEENRLRFQDRLRAETSQEIGDLNKAIRYALALNNSKIAIVGAAGLREDHALANLSMLLTFCHQREMIMVTDHGVFYPADKTITLPSVPGQQISIFSFDPTTRLTLRDLRYPVQNHSFKYFWEGALNEALSDEFTIEFERGEVLVYCCY